MAEEKNRFEYQKHLVFVEHLHFIAKAEVQLRILETKCVKLQSSLVQMVYQKLLFQNPFLIILDLNVVAVLDGHGMLRLLVVQCVIIDACVPLAKSPVSLVVILFIHDLIETGLHFLLVIS